MCRHLAYLGEPRSPAETLFHAPHSLLVQSYAPADMRGGGSVNADGYGLGWYAEAPDPLRLRRSAPLWTDGDLPALAGSVRSPAFMAAVRNGTTGMPVVEAANAPFTGGGYLFSHNGVVRGWPDSVAELAAELPITRLLTMEATTDSVLLWALLRERLEAGEDPLAAVTWLTGAVEEAAPGSRLNFLLTEGRTLIGTAWTHSLSYRDIGGGVLVASEPCDDDPGWIPVPDHHAVRVTGEGVRILPLEADRSPEAR
ncbi:ergothioneine biosynthesis protein EgtC [Amycolatopsis azurea]|uniref:Gamma-glutamyl-hercynylcysteine sulfoxide hydrolase n=1 Tax=Amycolatopsis azurea DSM 43854 TaxID=1238180 RepID=M2QTX6_9PSEU|nr:ergothioneine biosynthesis protein EgtC [Amycolatopsis azurea]EMD29956.1 Glutamine amidotransferase class-II [Amycolatopsis azurea DSM 43854]OOC04796.1 class II glutamine amidotransferase [Amycolatopsis azurea DSM 43854]